VSSGTWRTTHRHLIWLGTGLSLACTPSEYAGMGNACPAVSEAFARADTCEESASAVETICKSSRTVATVDGCRARFDEYYHCIDAWSQTDPDALTLRCGSNSWGVATAGSKADMWCTQEEDALDTCLE